MTDDMDRRLLLTYVSDYFHEEVLQTQFYKLVHVHFVKCKVICVSAYALLMKDECICNRVRVHMHFQWI